MVIVPISACCYKDGNGLWKEVGDSDNELLFTKCDNMTMVTFGVGGDGSKPCIAPMASCTSHQHQIMAKK